MITDNGKLLRQDGAFAKIYQNPKNKHQFPYFFHIFHILDLPNYNLKNGDKLFLLIVLEKLSFLYILVLENFTSILFLSNPVFV